MSGAQSGGLSLGLSGGESDRAVRSGDQGEQQASTDRPNVLWIIADQLRYQALACNGDPNVATPNLDALAAQGVNCTQAVSHYPVCTPFRAALMTGQYAQANGVQRHGDAAVGAQEQRAFEAHMLMEMARMSIEDGLVMQIHAGAYRNHNRKIYERFGPDKGGDIPVTTEWSRNLEALLSEYGSDPGFTVIVFTLDESTYARELAPLAGHYPAMRIGPAWWFHDSIEGMRRYKENLVETPGIYNLAGFNDDTRAFLSIPARHDLARRIDANYVAGLVARHQVDMSDARQMMRALTYDLARSTYRFDTETPVSVS